MTPTTPTTARDASDTRTAGDDQTPMPVTYGHGRLPMFMKVLWVGFLVFITYYVAAYLIPAAGTELAQ